MGMIRINQKVRHVTEDEHVHPSFSKYFLVSSYVIAVLRVYQKAHQKVPVHIAATKKKCIGKWLIIEYVIMTAICFSTCTEDSHVIRWYKLGTLRAKWRH